MSQPSRFDTKELLSANAGIWFCDKVLRGVVGGVNRFQCDIQTVASHNERGRAYLSGTKVVLLLGEKAQREVGLVDTSLGEQRGSPITAHPSGIPHISSYPPQDCFDMVDHESRLNPALNGDTYTTGDSEPSDDDEKSRHGSTARSNFRFWLTRDVAKTIRILRHGLTLPPEPTYNIYPSSSEIIAALTSHRNEIFFLDIETDSDLNITCFGFSFGTESVVYVAPLLRYTYAPAYDNTGRILRALCYAMHHNTTVAHNGAGFDWFVLAYKYGIPLGNRVYDTMLAHHRCYPEVEKSLGHAISNFTDLPYHKNEGIFEPQSTTQEQALWSYNGKDVFAMREVKAGIDAYAATVPGMEASIRQVNASVRGYLTAMVQGIAYDQSVIDETLAGNDRVLNGILRLLEGAVGKERLAEIRGSGESAMPGSSKQCVRYFHDLCGYPIVKRSVKTGEPSLDEKNFLKLVMKLADKGIVNPVVALVLAYREVAKESSMLKFEPWCGIKQLKTNK